MLARMLGSVGGGIARSHNDWGGEQNIVRLKTILARESSKE